MADHGARSEHREAQSASPSIFASRRRNRPRPISGELQGVAKRHGWSVVQVFEDAGISGAKGRNERPALDALLKAVARREVDMVAAWSVDRLGRSLTDLLDLLRELHAKQVDLFLHSRASIRRRRLAGRCSR